MNRRQQSSASASATEVSSKGRQKAILKSLTIPLAIALLGLLGLSLLPDPNAASRSREEPPAPSSTPTEPAPAVAEPSAKLEFSALQGQWVRDDGGYVLAIKKAAPDGALDATYHNPRPIFVAKAQANLADEQLKVFVELRDEGYPGCTYNLIYDSRREELRGDYYQAALQKTYPVVFRRGQ